MDGGAGRRENINFFWVGNLKKVKVVRVGRQGRHTITTTKRGLFVAVWCV
jgi:hypothetical protein